MTSKKPSAIASINHIGVDGLIGQIEEAGGRRRTKTWEINPGGGRYLAYAEDPFGNAIELYTHSYEETWAAPEEGSEQ